jgi:hypothetical protein
MSEAVMFWGLGVERPLWDGEWTVWAIDRLGMNRPWSGPVPSPAAIEQARHLISEETGCTIGTYGGGRFFVAITQSVSQSPGAPRPAVGADWRERLEEFCQELEIPWSEPSWGGKVGATA